MSITSDSLFAYLRSIFYNRPDTDYTLDLSSLDEDYVLLGKGLMYFAENVSQYYDYAKALAKGDLSAQIPPRENELAAPLKSLQSNLKHLTYQTQRVAEGDYRQRVDFMGEFADAFNTMVEQLVDRQRRLEDEIDVSRKHAEAMEQSNMLMSKLTQYMTEQILVYSTENLEVLHCNEQAKGELSDDPDYFEKVIELLAREQFAGGGNNHEIRLLHDGAERFLSINTYKIEWFGEQAAAMVINDISAERVQLRELEKQAYRDALTNVHNRFFGMLTLNEWLGERKRFALIFTDLDSLKAINDIYGHNEGDRYLTKVAKHLENYSRETLVCRLGGDEFMLLVPNESSVKAHHRMGELQQAIQGDECPGNDYSYSISFGIVAVDESNHLSSSEILSIADARMYKHKRARKKERMTAAQDSEHRDKG